MRKDCKDNRSFSILQIFFQERRIFRFSPSARGFRTLFSRTLDLRKNRAFLKCGCKGSDNFRTCKYFRIFLSEKVENFSKSGHRRIHTYYIILYNTPPNKSKNGSGMGREWVGNGSEDASGRSADAARRPAFGYARGSIGLEFIWHCDMFALSLQQIDTDKKSRFAPVLSIPQVPL